MSRFFTVLAAALAAFVVSSCAHVGPAPSGERPLVVLVSIDGFRPDYLDRGLTPNLSRLAADGVRASMRPSFPSKTFPNHYTLVTGLRPDHHGIVENNMLDPSVSADQFTMAKSADPRWWAEGTPIWESAERQGVRTATMFWPGSDVPIHGMQPTYWKKYDEDFLAPQRVDGALAWLDQPSAQRPRLLTLYFDEVDTEGHHFGPTSAEVNKAIASTDVQIGRLVEGLKAREIPANIVVVADHGMADISADRRIFMDDVLPKAAYRSLAMGAFGTFYPQPGHEAEVDKALIRPHAHMECWRKAQIPERFHYGKNPRVAPYFCLPQIGWSVTTRDYKPKNPEAGAHGYDPYAPEMAAVFVANGPSFRHGATLPTFDNVSVYPLLTRLLGIRPEKNDGRPADTEGALAR